MRYEDELKGKGKKVSGAVKEELGKALNKPGLRERGQEERTEGQVQETIGRARRKVGEAVSKTSVTRSRANVMPAISQ